jgi:hypothetical protein
MLRGILCVVCFVGACSASEKSPVAKCDDLVDDVCNRAIECLGAATVGSHSACVQQIHQALPCGSAKGVSASYDRCINQINTDSCPVLFPPDPQTGNPMLMLPADCKAVILARGLVSPEGPPWADEMSVAGAVP